MRREINLSIVIPVYNSETILEELIFQIDKNTLFAGPFEIILVNDCSRDGSWKKILSLSDKYPFIKGINLRRNVGQHNAIMAGLHYARGAVVVTMDDDLQHPPSYLKDLYEKIVSGSDVCYAQFEKIKQAGWKILGSRFNNMVADVLLQKPKDVYLSPFKAISGEIRDEIIKYDGPYPYIDGLILSVTQNISTITVEHNKRFQGKGNYNLKKSIALWLKMATGYSVLPLRLATYAGLSISVAAFLGGIYYFLFAIVNPSAPKGWTTLVLIILFLGGIQLFALGIFGEYIGRMYLKLNSRPQFVIKETTP